jgi:hypothetical protein
MCENVSVPHIYLYEGAHTLVPVEEDPDEHHHIHPA